MDKDTKPKTIDLSSMTASIKSPEGAVCEIKHPHTGDPVGLRITLVSSDSARHQESVSKIKDRDLGLMERRGKRELTAAEIDRRAVSILVEDTIAWEWYGTDWPGKTEFTKENVTYIYTEAKWIYDQVDAFVGDRANFLQK